MKKILIWDTIKLENTGGPAGYLYNIYEFLKRNPSEQIYFLSDLIACATNVQTRQESSNQKEKSLFCDICNFCPSFIKKLFFFKYLKKCIDTWLHAYFVLWGQFRQPLAIPKNINLNEYDFIHFHSMLDFLKFKNSALRYNGKKIYTSHCPCTWTDEKLSFEKKWMQHFRFIVFRQELQCYRLADYIMFPCKDAQEPYEKEPLLRKLLESNEKKIFFVPTGILKTSTQSNVDLSHFGIPSNSFVIGFFGRHSKIKGYNQLKDLASKLLNKHDNLYFLCAGKGEIPPLKHSHWIELGFVSNVQNFLPKCDLYISPNQSTYFDLIVLEILRAGTIILLSNNGGNLFFKTLPKSETTGIDFFDAHSTTELEEKVEKFISEKKENPTLYLERKKANTTLFTKRFTIDIFVKNYISAVKKL